MSPPHEAMKVKIGKLLALALDRAGTPEGDLAAVRAMELMERHGVAEGDVRPAAEQNPIVHRFVEIPRAGWVYAMLAPIGALTGALVVKDRGAAILAGRRTDVGVAEYLLGSLRHQCNAAAGNERRRRERAGPPPTRYEMRTFRDSWVAGLTVKVGEVLRAQRRARAAGASMALAPRNRAEEARTWLEENTGVRLAPFRQTMRSWDQRGVTAGRRATITPGIDGREARRLKP